MGKTVQRQIIILVILLTVLIGIIKVTSFSSVRSGNESLVSNTTSTSDVMYYGKNDVDALTLLKEQGPVEQDASGLVTAINEREAQSAKHEFWAFYVNGKMSTVGPKEYTTKDTDIIEWKIETY